MAWLNPPAEPPNVEPEFNPSEPSEHTLNYWAARLQPFHDPTPKYHPELNATSVEKNSKEVIFVACNRIGTEEGMA